MTMQHIHNAKFCAVRSYYACTTCITDYTPGGCSVVDYFIMSEDLHVQYCGVGDLSEYSDHHPLVLSLGQSLPAPNIPPALCNKDATIIIIDFCATN